MIKKIILLFIICSNLSAGRYASELVRICEEEKNQIKRKTTYGKKIELDLTGRNLETLEGIEYINLDDFDGINLSHNCINSLEPLASLPAKKRKKIKYIYLMSNQISDFSEVTIKKIQAAFPNLKILDLVNNPLVSTEIINKFNEKYLFTGFIILHAHTS